MHAIVRRLFPLLFALLIPCARAAAQQTPSRVGNFTWAGSIPAGQWIRIRDLNGSVSVRAATGDRVEVTAVKSTGDADPPVVRFEVVKVDGGSVVICALWGESATCDSRGSNDDGHGARHRHNEIAVDFTVALPRGVNVDASTVNGRVEITGAAAEVSAHTVNGRVDVASSSGVIDASTVNGDVRVALGLAPQRDLRFRTVNGGIVLTLPPELDATIEMSTVNGGFRSDYPVTVAGALDPRHLRATVGKGGPRISAATVNGSLELRKAH